MSCHLHDESREMEVFSRLTVEEPTSYRVRMPGTKCLSPTSDCRDEATLSEDGRLTICGRIQDRICRGEEVVDCREIEECLSSHAAVEEAQVGLAFSAGPPGKSGNLKSCLFSWCDGVSLHN